MLLMQIPRSLTRIAWLAIAMLSLAQPLSATAAITGTGAVVQERTIDQWLTRLHEASRRRAYMGTFVVSAGEQMSASKIWHVCDGTQQIERVETLTGDTRVTLRRNDQVVTFVHGDRTVMIEKRDALRLFPDLLKSPDNHIAELYSAKGQGLERIAGFDAEVVDFVPRDLLRFGYRIWSEKKTGLVIKLQTRDLQDHVLEQVVFTELQMNAPVRMDVLAREMGQTAGFQVRKSALRKTSPDAEGWRLARPVPGFRSMSSYARDSAEGPSERVLQWIFSDGLASVSLFIEPWDPQQHTQELVSMEGATHLVNRRLGNHWVTAMGEVPVETLKLFLMALERLR